MKVINPSFLLESDFNGEAILKHIEKIGRVAYKSEERITADSASKFIEKIVANGHLAVIEHFVITVRVICDRGVTHEIVRHRLASYCQESTRYCNYTKGKFGSEITVIKPSFWDIHSEAYKVWEQAMKNAEDAYCKLIELGTKPQEARSVLPNSLKTEIVMTMNLREWRHFFELRTASKAHPQMQEIARPMLDEFKKKIPVIFDDILYC